MNRFKSCDYWADNRMAHRQSSVSNFGLPPHELRVSPDIADLKAHEGPIFAGSTSSCGAFTRPIARFLVISLSFLVKPIVFSIMFLFDIALAYGLC
jgi:hypothetical protein